MTETLDQKGLEVTARAVAARHYAQRFSTVEENPIVAMNVEANWHIFLPDIEWTLSAYLAATRSPLPADADGARVKPLEWRGDVTSYYRLEHDSKGMVGLLRLSSAGLWDPSGVFSSAAEAKAAAQADFATRIKSSLIRGEAAREAHHKALDAAADALASIYHGSDADVAPFHAMASKAVGAYLDAGHRSDPKTFEEAPAPQEGGEVAPGVVGRLMEYTAIIEAASAMARRMGLRFVPDSDKITAFVSQNSAVTPTPNSDGGKAL